MDNDDRLKNLEFRFQILDTAKARKEGYMDGIYDGILYLILGLMVVVGLYLASVGV